jgi:hypothetical protein
MNVPTGGKNGESAPARLAGARRVAGLDRRCWISAAGTGSIVVVAAADAGLDQANAWAPAAI